MATENEGFVGETEGLRDSRERVGDLTAAERAELEELRAAKVQRDNQPPAENKPEENLPDTHWLHLANGDVITARGTATHVGGVPVIGSYDIPEGYEGK